MAFAQLVGYRTVLERLKMKNCESWLYRKIDRITSKDEEDIFLGHFASLVPRMFNRYVHQYWRDEQ
jgi:hypothetical protein